MSCARGRSTICCSTIPEPCARADPMSRQNSQLTMPAALSSASSLSFGSIRLDSSIALSIPAIPPATSAMTKPGQLMVGSSMMTITMPAIPK